MSKVPDLVLPSPVQRYQVDGVEFPTEKAALIYSHEERLKLFIHRIYTDADRMSTGNTMFEMIVRHSDRLHELVRELKVVRDA